MEIKLELRKEDERMLNDLSPNSAEERITWCKPSDTLRHGVRNEILHQLIAPNNDVNHPSHYNDGEIEVIDYIEDKKLNFHLGNVVKYISRAGKKCPDKEIEDLKKAKWYLDRYIEMLERRNDEKEV